MNKIDFTDQNVVSTNQKKETFILLLASSYERVGEYLDDLIIRLVRIIASVATFVGWVFAKLKAKEVYIFQMYAAKEQGLLSNYRIAVKMITPLLLLLGCFFLLCRDNDS